MTKTNHAVERDFEVMTSIPPDKAPIKLDYSSAHVAGVCSDKSGLTRVINGNKEVYYYSVMLTPFYIKVPTTRESLLRPWKYFYHAIYFGSLFMSIRWMYFNFFN